MKSYSIIRIVCNRKVLFTYGLSTNNFYHCDAAGYDITIDEETFGGWFELHPIEIVFNDSAERTFKKECIDLYTALCQTLRIHEIAEDANRDLTSLTDDELERYTEMARVVCLQRVWRCFDKHRWLHLAFLQKLRTEKVRRLGYQITSSADYGYVYLVKSSTGHWKIGKSINPDRRVLEFVPGSVILPFEYTLEHVIETDNRHDLESRFHNLYANKRDKGEWFLLTDADVEDIKRYKTFIVTMPKADAA